MRIFTIGHSNHPAPVLIDLLRRFSISLVIDVRSAPYSRYVPHFNKDSISKLLPEAGFHYLFLGQQLGGKPPDSKGKETWERLRHSDQFKTGVKQLKKLTEEYTICLLCAEEDPGRCHRHHLLARELVLFHHYEVWHIRKDGTLDRALHFSTPQPRQISLF